MTFRDDADAARARADALQRELEETEGELSRVRAENERLKAGPTRLVVVEGPMKGVAFDLDGDRLVIGRTDDNEIVLNHRSISRHHACIVRAGDRWKIIDMQSANGLRVNGEEVSEAPLVLGSRIELGHIHLRVVGPEGQSVSAPPEASETTAKPVPWRVILWALFGAGCVALYLLFSS